MGALAKRIKHYRQKAGLTQVQVAEGLGMAQANYSKYETGAREPRRDKLLELSKILEVAFMTLEHGEESLLNGLLLRHMTGAILGDVEGFYAFFSDVEGNAYSYIQNVFQVYANIFQRTQKDLYNKYLKTPSYGSLVELYGLYTDADENYDGATIAVGTEKGNLELDVNIAYKLMFCIATAEYLHVSTEPELVLADAKEYHSLPDNDKKALQTFTVDLFAPYIAFLTDTLEMLAINNCFIDDFELNFLFGGLTPDDNRED